MELKIDYSNMSIWKKIQVVKERLLQANLKKSGENKFSGFKYYELSDFTPTIIRLCNEVGLFTKFTFNNEEARLTVINCDKPDQKEEYTSPMRELQLKGCNDIQALGGVETYSRRYLYMSAFDIVENDMFDAVAGKEEKAVKKENTTRKEKVKATASQIETMKKLYSEEELQKALSLVKREKLEDMTVYEASNLISKRAKKEEAKENED